MSASTDPGTLAIALREWAVVSATLTAGQTILAVRKGGIHERGGGLFVPEHERFLLLPSWLHQDAARLRPDVAEAWADVLAGDPRPGTITLAAWATVERTWKVTDARVLDRLADELVLSVAEAKTRFAYRDQPWLYVLALRVHHLPTAVHLPDDPSYAGCRSWVPLNTTVATSIATTGSEPVLSDPAFADRLAALFDILDPTQHP